MQSSIFLYARLSLFLPITLRIKFVARRTLTRVVTHRDYGVACEKRIELKQSL